MSFKNLEQEVRRISELDRRTFKTSDEQATKATKQLGRPVLKCNCKIKWGFCIDGIKPIQAAALSEARKVGGLLAPIGVGHGKTGIDLLLPGVMSSAVTVLLLPASLVKQFTTRDWPQWSVHFKTPNIYGSQNPHIIGRPMMHIISYSQLSTAKNTDILNRIKPDLIIADEAHYLRSPNSARNKRVFRYLEENKATVRFCALSGTIMKNSIKDFSHLLAHTHKNQSPMPTNKYDIMAWADIVDEKLGLKAPLGELEKLLSAECPDIRSAIRDRVHSTLGVAYTSSQSVDSSLRINELDGNLPEEIQLLINKVELLGQNPQGDEAESALEMSLWKKHLVQGFYNYLDFTGIDPDLAQQWFDARKAYHKEVRQTLEGAVEGMDSPLLLAQAHERWKKGTRDRTAWNSKYRQAWLDIKDSIDIDKIRHTRWISDYFVTKIVSQVAERPIIVWVESTALGQKLSKVTGWPYYHTSTQDIEGTERGDRTVIASISSCSEGKNLQYTFSENLVTCPPACCLRWEQLIGRTLRQGQKADEVMVEVFQHAECYKKAFADAKAKARVTKQTMGTDNVLLIADYIGTDPALDI